jgi:D-serine deaminase-like pyridoxal phosphate-dependent protein
MSMNEINDLETPAAIVDLDRLTRNLDRAATYAKEHGLALRPHVKTHKSSWIAAEQMQRGAVGVTCATPREAEVMSRVSDDILLAYPPVGKARAARIAELARGDKVTVALDSLEAIEQIEHAASDAGVQVGVYVELDLGMHRVGVPAIEAAIGLAKRIENCGSLSYEGIAFYPGTFASQWVRRRSHLQVSVGLSSRRSRPSSPPVFRHASSAGDRHPRCGRRTR